MEWTRLPPLSALRAFAAYAETGAVQKAAAALNVSHPAISQHIRNLEAHIGVTLLDRAGRSAQLTAEGRILAEALARGFGQISDGVAALTEADAARPLHITATPNLAAQWLLPRLPGFREEQPDIDIVIDPNPALSDPAPGGVDVAIRHGAGHWEGLVSQPLFATEIVVVAAPGLVADRIVDGPAALADLPWISELGRNEASDWLAAHGVTARGSVTQMPGSFALDAVRQGQGVMATARPWVESDLRSGRLQLLFAEPEEEGLGYHVVTRPGPHRPPLRAFLRWLSRQGDAGRRLT